MRLPSLILSVLVATTTQAQTVYVAPVPQPGDPAYIPYQLNQLSETLRENEVDAARVEAFRAQAAVNQALLEKINREELEALVQLAELLETAGTEDQRQALGAVITSKLEALLPASFRSFPPGTTLVVASPGFHWAAEHVAGVVGGKPIALNSSRSEIIAVAKADTNVVGVIEVEVNVHQVYETVRAVCYRPDGTQLWKEGRVLNSGGNAEKVARDMVGALLKKVRGKSCP